MIGKRYKEEKREAGYTKTTIDRRVMANSLPLLDDKSTAEKIASQSNISQKTVKNAEKFADAVDTVAENV